MGIFSLISGAIKPLTNLVDELHTSDDERLKAKTILIEIERQLASDYISYESKLVDAKSSIIVAEAQSSSWITRSWRPITMLTFVALIVMSFFSQIPIPPDLWFVIKLGLGGYVGGRSLEKTLPAVVGALKAKEKV